MINFDKKIIVIKRVKNELYLENDINYLMISERNK